jgi:hypothetical protein
LSKLYVTPLAGLVTVIIPVADAQVGCVTEVTGIEGVTGWVFTVVAIAVEIHPPALFFTIT